MFRIALCEDDAACRQLSIQRHDLRHRFQTLNSMLEKGEVQSAREYISSSQETLTETAAKRWCLNPILDAVFSAYCEKHGASCEYRTRNGWFTIQIVQVL